MSSLSTRDCIPCKQGDPALTADAIAALRDQLGGAWRVTDGPRLECDYEFPDFVQALAFTNRVGQLAEEQNHHPDIRLSWGKVKIEIWTHVVDGLTESDFVWAAKADALL
jgi:4a-hydroxytetrahydrobiopterin dehydratase